MAKVPKLMGTAEVCAELGVRDSNLRKVVGLPEPVQQVRATRLWLASDIRALAARRRRAAVAAEHRRGAAA